MPVIKSSENSTLIASVFYDIGWVEAKGTGFRTTMMELPKAGYPQPKWENNKKQDTFTLSFFYPSEKITDQVTDQVEIRDRMAKLLKFCEEPRSLKEMLEFLRLKHRPNFRKQILHPLLDKGYLKRTMPDKPSSRFQKYVAVKKGEK
jgi:ATP-dependent DNA helicase RecG